MGLLSYDHGSDANPLKRIEELLRRVDALERVSPLFPASSLRMETPDAIVTGDTIWARVYNNANISISNDTATVLTFNAERWDTDAIHSLTSSPGRLRCRTAGVYNISANVRFAVDATGWRHAAIKYNGGNYLKQDARLANSTFGARLVLDTTYYLGVGDYVEVEVYQNSGLALNVIAQANYSPEFMMVRIP